jgi:hypothetical protein
MRAYRLSTTAAAVLSSALALPLAAQDAAPIYETPQAALDALVAAISAGDAAAAVAAMDPAATDLVEAEDPEAVAETLSDLTERYREGYRFVPQGADAVVIELGKDGWPFPVPILRGPDGWRFDAAAAREEILARQIGANELDVIDTLDAYVDIQRDFRLVDHDGDGVLEFASAILSSEGRRDGLYWPGDDSPLGDVAARASLDGVDADAGERERRAVSGLLLPHPHGPGRRGSGRRHELPRQRTDGGGARASCRTRRLRRDRRPHVHGGRERGRASGGSGTRLARRGLRHHRLRSGRGVGGRRRGMSDLHPTP